MFSIQVSQESTVFGEEKSTNGKETFESDEVITKGMTCCPENKHWHSPVLENMKAVKGTEVQLTNLLDLEGKIGSTNNIFDVVTEHWRHTSIVVYHHEVRQW